METYSCLSNNIQYIDTVRLSEISNKLNNIGYKFRSQENMLKILVRIQSRFRGIIVREKVGCLRIFNKLSLSNNTKIVIFFKTD